MWNDSLFWAIRPDSVTDARGLLERLEVSAAGLHRDNLWRKYSAEVARYLDLDEMPVDINGRVAVVTVSGILVNQWNPFTANYPVLTAAFERLRADDNIAAVVVRFQTPGGTVSGLQPCAEALGRLAETKLTVAQVDGGCYSAGYYLACFCGSICSGETDQLGNIGCVSCLYDVSEMMQKEGVRAIVQRTGPIKGVGIFGDPITEAQRAFLGEMCQEHFSDFAAAVKNGRGMSDEQFAAVSDGRWWTGRQAVQNGICDRVQTLSETIDQLKTLV